jgi:hypothetical protein
VTEAITGGAPKTLLAVVEFLAHTRLAAVYQRLGYRVVSEYSVRKAIALVRKEGPQVIAADFYYQPDFRDRVSNLESLLAAVQSSPGVKTLVFYDPRHQEALDKVRRRFRIDAALTTPVREEVLESLLESWL